jgi:hypothetical protein
LAALTTLIRFVGGIFIDWGDTDFYSACHEIFGVIAVQHTQLNYRTLGLGAALLVVLVFAGKSAFSEGLSAREKSPPILTNNTTGSCDPELAQADLVPGTDVDGNPVAGVDLPTGPIPYPGQIAVPLRARAGRSPAYVTVDGAKLGPLLNPASACN